VWVAPYYLSDLAQRMGIPFTVSGEVNIPGKGDDDVCLVLERMGQLLENQKARFADITDA
jgi:hypothetical protein